MITKCRSYTGNCPCVDCEEECCVDSCDKNGMTDTEKLCDEAKEYCEACASKYAEREKEEGEE